MAAEENSSEIVKEQSESVAASNLKCLGDAPAFFQNQMYSQAVQAAAGWTTIQQSVVGKIAESIIAVQPAEGGADIAAMAQLAKIVQGTPPPTNIPTQGT